MLHYQLYKALADDRERALAAAVKRNEQLAAARRHDDASASSTRHTGVTTALMALLPFRRGVRAHSAVPERGAGPAMVTGSGTSPIGCSA